MAEPIAGALHRWLVGPEVVDDDGGVWSWRPGGYRYPEAAGLWLAWASIAAPDHPRAPAVAAWLERAIVDDAVGRDGVGYTFDLGVALGGLLRWSRTTGTTPGEAVRTGAAQLVAAIVERRAVTTIAAPDRWSSRFGPHQRKLVVALDHVELAGLADTRRAREALWQSTGGDQLDVTAAAPQPTYVHAAAYALEGSWVMGAHDTAARGASWLAEIQRPDGGVSAWWDRVLGAHGPSRSDATAQAVRLWCVLDRQRYAAAIDRGARFLVELCDPAGGVRYDETCAHRNVWCSLFTWQALVFVDGAARPEALL